MCMICVCIEVSSCGLRSPCASMETCRCYVIAVCPRSARIALLDWYDAPSDRCRQNDCLKTRMTTNIIELNRQVSNYLQMNILLRRYVLYTYIRTLYENIYIYIISTIYEILMCRSQLLYYMFKCQQYTYLYRPN